MGADLAEQPGDPKGALKAIKIYRSAVINIFALRTQKVGLGLTKLYSLFFRYALLR